MRPLHARPRNASRSGHSSPVRRSLLLPLPLAVLLAWQFALVAPAQAAAGDLDLSFGVGGKVTTDFGGTDEGLALAVQADGRLVAAGLTATPACCNFALARYLAH